MENEFTKSMIERSDEDLIRIVTTERSGYQPLALEAAEAEIKNREIDDSEFEEIQANVAALEKARLFEKMNKASMSSRLANYMIDSLITSVIFVLLSAVSMFIAESYMYSELFFLIIVVFMFLGYLGYYYFMESRNGKTLGKYVTKTIVVKQNGKRPSKKDIAIRTLCRLIPFDRFSFLFDAGFHDSISGTKVVNDNGQFISSSNPDLVDSDFL